MEIEIEQAQRALEQKRAEQRIKPSTEPQSLLDFLPAIFPTGAESGEIPPAEICGLHGDILPCEECERQRSERRAGKERRAAAAFRGIQIGARYHGANFDDYVPADGAAARVLETCRRYAATFPARLKDCDSLLMLGNPGTGKNMLAAIICKEVVAQGFTPLHTTAMKVVRRIKESWGKSAEVKEQDAINSFSKPDLLVIDEVGVQYGSETEKILLFEVINERYEQMKPTIIISNLSLKDVGAYLGERIIDRFHEGKSTVLEFTWESYRRRK